MRYTTFAKKTLKIFILISTIIAFNIQATIFITPKQPKINARSYIVIDYNSQKTIAANKEHDKHPPASLTKIMTTYVVFQLIKDGIISLQDDVKISKKAAQTEGSTSFIEAGNTIKLGILLQAMIIQSGNDAAVALAEHIAGTEGTFAAYMNEYAQELGLKNTYYENSSGLPHKNQYTSAYDSAIIAIATIRNFPEFYAWYGKKEFTYNNIKQLNRNSLLWSDKTIDGLKTGFTEKAGYCLVASAKRIGMRLVSVVLGSKSSNARNEQTQKILDYGFRFFETRDISNISKEVPLYKSIKNTLRVGLNKPAYVTLHRNQFKFTKQIIKLDTNLSAPIKKGETVGGLTLIFEDQTLAELPLIALENAKKAGFFKSMIDSVKIYLE